MLGFDAKFSFFEQAIDILHEFKEFYRILLFRC